MIDTTPRTWAADVSITTAHLDAIEQRMLHLEKDAMRLLPSGNWQGNQKLYALRTGIQVMRQDVLVVLAELRSSQVLDAVPEVG